MNFTIKHLFSFLLTGIVATTLVSCENEDECFTPLESFKLTLLDTEGEDIYGGEEPAFDSENIRIYFINEDESEEEVAFNFKTPEEGNSYIESLPLSEESLGGEEDFFLEISEETTINLNIVAEKIVEDGCTSHPFTKIEANGEELSEDEDIYSLTIEAEETE